MAILHSCVSHYRVSQVESTFASVPSDGPQPCICWEVLGAASCERRTVTHGESMGMGMGWTAMARWMKFVEPICSMYGIYTNIGPKKHPNVAMEPMGHSGVAVFFGWIPPTIKHIYQPFYRLFSGTPSEERSIRSRRCLLSWNSMGRFC